MARARLRVGGRPAPKGKVRVKVARSERRETVILPSDRYTYRVIWSEEDEEYVGLCAEFPGLSWLAAMPEEALVGIQAVVADVVSDMRDNGEDVAFGYAIQTGERTPSVSRDEVFGILEESLPITECRRLMAEQAQRMLAHYKETAAERQAWQAGDFIAAVIEYE